VSEQPDDVRKKNSCWGRVRVRTLNNIRVDSGEDTPPQRRFLVLILTRKEEPHIKKKVNSRVRGFLENPKVGLWSAWCRKTVTKKEKHKVEVVRKKVHE